MMNLAISITALALGLSIVLLGQLADRYRRVRLTLIGVLLNVAGCAVLVLATSHFAVPLLLAGRVLQGVSAACIMPATMGLLTA